MDDAAQPDTPGGLSIFEKACVYCGARFRVLAPHDVLDHAESYACPECGKEYQVEAADEPQVQLLMPRRDGKHDRYQETMF
jgi:predicted RNA-binding Zn-ribbon protein involved in translation (DUF1610 family)